jgi:hypothetical protein
MKKVGIVTSHTSFSSNYGAVLQCYALVEQLKLWGYEPNVINYSYTNNNVEMTIDNSIDRSLNAKIKYIFSADVSILQKFQYRINRNNRNNMEKKFINFYEEFLPMHSKDKVTFDELCQHPLNYDYYITGSDQVWNPVIHGNQNDPCCFLRFAERESKKIAYAPSFGIKDYPKNLEDNLKKYVVDFDSLSVREKEGKEIIKRVCNIDVPVVLDPTLMADPIIYNVISKKPENLPKKYILCYRFGNMEYSTKIIKEISKALRLPVVELPLSIESYGKGSKLCYNIGPAEFIGAIQNAEVILTDSFHCTVFSILNKKPFYTFLRQKENEKNNMNGRMIELLNKLNISERLISEEEKCRDLISKLYDIDYTSVYNILDRERNKSQEYLRKSLENKR